jgi:hypothetical protein
MSCQTAEGVEEERRRKRLLFLAVTSPNAQSQASKRISSKNVT